MKHESNPTNVTNHEILQRIRDLATLSNAGKIAILKTLMATRVVVFYPEYLDLPEPTELKFTVSPYNLLSNLIESSRATQAKKLAGFGQPYRRDVPHDDVSETAPLVFFPNAYSVEVCSPFRFITRLRLSSLSQQTLRVFATFSPTNYIVIPGSHVGFPLLVETLPVWMLFGAFGHYYGHELTHIFDTAAKTQAGNKRTHPDHRWYYDRYEVRFHFEEKIPSL